MATITKFPDQDDLLRRQTIELELPRFLVRIFEREVARANQEAESVDELITVNNYIEYHLAEFVSLADVVEMEREVPGLGAAVWSWLEQSNS